MNVAEWAQTQHIHPQTAYRWHRQGRLPVPARRVGGLIMVGDLDSAQRQPRDRTVVYARVSSADQKADLDRQVARVTAWATTAGYAVDQVVTEVGSALGGKRRKFLGLLGDPEVTTIIVEHRDRFARFGAEYVAAALAAEHRRMVVDDDAEVDDDLVRDMTEVMTSLCARLYGRRSAAHRAARAVEVAVGGQHSTQSGEV
ncbi:MAG: IS607 family transposase [Actinomycetota bacterium]|nr:IS607 family transposase [Actinomycetota bacterium]